ncbi:hypothetical protein [Agromyces ramosus]|uniref:DUF4345 domain-containing protein n=1 Tax=Agromyces ramosus TaxID=33879 RepID=A0ABU0R8C8_9MICO|nr:hypothetical protein [Agromyces ramosus]MDQ0894293.1 hypothetical protein [Agromyces ramosus]
MTVEKRPAFEPPAALIRPEPTPPTMHRPAATAFGALLVVARVLAGVAWLVSLWLSWPRLVAEELEITIDSVPAEEASNIVLAVILVGGAVVLGVELVLALLVYRGSNWARITVMVFATLSVSLAAIDYSTGETEISLRTTLFTLALDILVLLALSSRNARAYARRPRVSRHARPARSTLSA